MKRFVICSMLSAVFLGTASDPLIAQESKGRVVFLGVDGMDHALTQQFLDEGHLPHLSALAKRGGFVPLEPTNPAQSPVSWASLITGMPPGRTRIYGFLRPSFENGQIVPRPSMIERGVKEGYTPKLKFFSYVVALLLGALPLLLLRRSRRIALVLSLFLSAFLVVFLRWLQGMVPAEVPLPINLRMETALWKEFDDQGIRTVTLGAPCAFPAEPLKNGRLLCGLGVPDVMGTFGTTWVWQEDRISDDNAVTAMGGRRLQLLRKPGSRELSGAEWVGPVNPMGGGRLRVPVAISEVDDNSVALTYGEERVVLKEGVFSEFLPIRFTWHEDVGGVHALARVRLLRARSPLRIYVEPLQPDPRKGLSWAALASPMEFGRELAEEGLFETIGWPTATNPYNDGLIDAEAFLDDVRGVEARRHRMVLSELTRRKFELFFAVLSTPDRVQHMFFSDIDPLHPGHDPKAIATRGHVIRESYQAVDRLVGEVVSRLNPEDILMVVSDHGFAPFRTAVNLNRWLLEQGYLVLRSDARPEGRSLERDLEQSGAFRDVDWSKTRAYHMGLGRIWVNMRGREPSGIVSSAEVPSLTAEIREKLLALRHENRAVIASVALADELYGKDRVAASESSDLIVGFERGYRVSWNACLGGVDEPLFAPNLLPWSGDHCSVDPSFVSGVCFASVPLVGKGHVLDVLPTLRAFLRLPARAEAVGKSLWGPR